MYQLCWLLLSVAALAAPMPARYSAAFSYGHGQEADEHYNNQGFGLYFCRHLPPLDAKLYPALRLHYSHWQAATPEHGSNHNLALGLDLRAYLYPPRQQRINGFLQLVSGPTYLAKHRLGRRHLGALVALETELGAGVQWWYNQRSWSCALSFIHVCNAGLAKPNKAFNLPWVLRLERGW